MVVHHIETVQEYDTAVGAEGLVIVDYSAKWCGPCRAVAPKFQALSERYTNALFMHVDIDELEHQDITSVKGVPTFRFFVNGELKAQFSGANPAKIEQTIETLL
jgi:thioredoxin 1